MKYELVIFDFDGTLANTFDWFIDTLNQLAGPFNYRRIGEDEIRTLRLSNAHALYKQRKVSRWKTARIAARIRSMMAADIDRISLFEGVGNMLGELAENGVSLGIVSSNSEKNIRRILGDLAKHIDYFECGVSVFGKAKKLKKIVKKSGIPLPRAIFVGDEIRDIGAAQQIGIPYGVVSWGYNDFDVLKNTRPNEYYLEMMEIVEKNNA